MTAFYLIHVRNDGQGSGPDPRVLGPYGTNGEQMMAAYKVRNDELEPDDFILWLDLQYGEPEVGAFDPQFYTEATNR